MKKQFLIIPEKLNKNQPPLNTQLIFTCSGYAFFAAPQDTITKETITVFIDGYITPRNHIYADYRNLSQHQLVIVLYRRFGNDFARYLKGMFTIVMADNDNVRIYNDQLGLNKFFYSCTQNNYCFSNSFSLLGEYAGSQTLNANAFGLKALLNREVNGETLFAGASYSGPATVGTLSTNQVKIGQYWQFENLLGQEDAKTDYSYFADLIKNNIASTKDYFHPQNYSISLTGGKDSRTALAALLSSGIKPLGITYGNPKSKDAVYAKMMADKAGITHKIIEPEKTTEWIEQTVAEVLNLNNPLINIHRAHRYYALKKMAGMLGPDTAYYGGYMGGELLMGIYYDNLVFTDFLISYWEKQNAFQNIPNILASKFIRKEAIDIQAITKSLLELKTFNPSLDKKMQHFFGMFEIGVLHHSQDLTIAKHFINYPFAFFLDIDFLTALFSSKYNFFHQDNKSSNLLRRYGLYELNLNVQHILFPSLDTVPFAKKGSYNTKEFLRGPLAWSAIKALRYFSENKKYSSTYSYDENYKDVILHGLNVIIEDRNSPIHDIYNVADAAQKLKSLNTFAAESKWHPYSNIVMHYMQSKKFLS
jgi:hypothetical protein